MITFVELTEYTCDGDEGSRLYLTIDRIVALRPADVADRTLISVSGAADIATILVKGSPQEVALQICDAAAHGTVREPDLSLAA